MLRVSQDVPPQVLLSTPVILLDARGQSAPFYLEFIDSAEVSAFIFICKADIADIIYVGIRRRAEGPLQGHWPAEN